jgi:uncharacterized protein (DUF58 family)
MPDVPSARTYACLPPRLADELAGRTLTVRGSVQGALQGLHRSPDFGSSVEFAEYRAYAPGDPAALIDWSVYARSDRYVIRRFQEETNLRAVIALDTSGSLGYRSSEDRPTKLGYAAMLAAGFLYVLIHQGDSARLVTFDAEVRERLPAAASMEMLRPSLEALDAARAEGASDIETALHGLAETLTGRTLVIVVSDFLEPPERILRGVQHLRHDRHDVTLFHVLDRGELSCQGAGLVEIEELERGGRLLVDLEEVRDAYAREVERYLDELRRGSAGMLVDYCLAETGGDPAAALAQRTVRR